MNGLFGTPTVSRFERKRYEHMDRGLARPAVRAYARAQGITYEDAHQILRNTQSKPEVTSVAPDKWKMSRTDAEYRKHQAQACNNHYQRVYQEFGYGS